MALEIEVNTKVDVELEELAEHIVAADEAELAKFLDHVMRLGGKPLGKTTRIVPGLLGEELAAAVGLRRVNEAEVFFLDLLCGLWGIAEKNALAFRTKTIELATDILKEQDKG